MRQYLQTAQYHASREQGTMPVLDSWYRVGGMPCLCENYVSTAPVLQILLRYQVYEDLFRESIVSDKWLVILW